MPVPKEDEQSKPASPPPERKQDSDARVSTPPPGQRRLRGYDRLEEAARIAVMPINTAGPAPDDLGPEIELPTKEAKGPTKE